jgi:hypothetical protein
MPQKMEFLSSIVILGMIDMALERECVMIMYRWLDIGKWMENLDFQKHDMRFIVIQYHGKYHIAIRNSGKAQSQ